jgi:N-acyl-D-aspartate/D-glutamate deacylase
MNAPQPALEMRVDILIKNAKVFNNGNAPLIEDIAIGDGRIVARGRDLAPQENTEVIDAVGLWAMPGLFDIHTHYDLELEVAPGLPESTRHGTTTVVIANCSLGLAFGAQRKDGADPIVDCYARVENMPKSVLRKCADKVTWNTPEEYLQHLDELPLGPNVATLFPHSMLRIDAMGFEASINRDPSDRELAQMQNTLRKALKLGYVGMSTDALPFHYLANQPNCHKTIPTQFAKYPEMKALTQVVREEDGIWQATPPKDSALQTLKTFLLTSARLHGKALRTTVVAAMDIANNRNIVCLGVTLARFLNSKWLKGDFHLQALGAPFKTWSDGSITPLAEEIPELRALNETDLEDREARLAILRDPEYIQAFKSMWLKGKQGWNIDRLKRKLRLEGYAFNRTLADMTVERCPLQAWQGLDMQTVFERVLAIKTDKSPGDAKDSEVKQVQDDFFWVADEADFMLQMLRSFDIRLSWSTTTANRDPVKTRELLMNPLLMPGFNDSGAHLTNMAFYDVNLRCLKIASEGGDQDVSYMVKRLTKDAADLFNVEGGTIDVGDVADLILVDPKALAAYDGERNVERVFREEYQHEQLVNRSDGVVPRVFIAGSSAWREGDFDPALGKKKMGRLLRRNTQSIAEILAEPA